MPAYSVPPSYYGQQRRTPAYQQPPGGFSGSGTPPGSYYYDRDVQGNPLGQQQPSQNPQNPGVTTPSVPQSARPQQSLTQMLAPVLQAGGSMIANAAGNVAGGINAAFGALGGARPAAAPMPAAPAGGVAAPAWTAVPDPRAQASQASNPYYSPPNLGNNLFNQQWNAYQQAPQNIASGINNAFDQYQFYTDRQSDRELKWRIAQQLLGGMNLGGGDRLRGFVDLNSGQAAALPGQTTNAITAQALTPQQIAGAAQQASGAGGTMAPNPAQAMSQPATPGQASEVNQIAAAAARNQGARNANEIDRGLTADNAQLQRAIELAKARQGIGNASFLTDLNTGDVQHRVAMQAPLIRALLQGVLS